jgi:hypothetical protein
MTKEELIHITLKQLIENFKVSPENFRLEDSDLGQTTGSFPGPTIIWQFKVQLKDTGQFIQDPLNSTRTIIVSYNKMAKQLTCLIYFREVNTLGHAVMPDTQAMIQCSDFFPMFFNRSYRQFVQLRELLVKQRREKEFVDYMRKLNSIFPSTHEDELFK